MATSTQATTTVQMTTPTQQTSTSVQMFSSTQPLTTTVIMQYTNPVKISTLANDPFVKYYKMEEVVSPFTQVQDVYNGIDNIFETTFANIDNSFYSGFHAVDKSFETSFGYLIDGDAIRMTIDAYKATIIPLVNKANGGN